MKYWITWLKSKLRDWDVTKKGLIILTASSKNLKTTARIKTTQKKKSERKKKQGWQKRAVMHKFECHLLIFTSETVVRRCSVKKVFLEISQNPQENACATCNFIIKEALAQVFSREYCEISKNTFYYRTSLVAASVTYIHIKK